MRDARHVVIVGGGASGTLTAIQLLRRGGPGLAVTVVEPRADLGRGVAFGTPDPWHRLNVPAVTMSGFVEDPDHFWRWAGVQPDQFPDRATYGRYLGMLLNEAREGSSVSFEHVRSRVTALDAARPAGAPIAVELGGGGRVDADAVVVATGNALPAIPPFLRTLAATGDPRFVRDPWAGAALEAVTPGETVLIVGTGHTAMDLAASVIRGRGAGRVVAVSRHGELPRSHEDPWRPRPPAPLFTAAELVTWPDPIEEAMRRIQAHPDGWRQGLDSLRPIHRHLWLALDEPTRRRFVADFRRTWEIHRSRISAGVARDIDAWMAAGTLEVRAAGVSAVDPMQDGLRVESDAGTTWTAGHVLLATGPDEAPSASPLLAGLVATGTGRPGSMDLGIDVDVATYRLLDAEGRSRRPVYALGPLIRGAVWETIAVPEIRAEAVAIATDILSPA
jgi:uncharacterized NAD(P)/FAD-binding protein YdhS